MMEQFHQEILRQLRKNIIDDLDIENDILEPLQRNKILERNDIENIYTGVSKEERAEKLLHILPRCGPHAFDVFHQSLKHHYIWLSEQIDKLLCNYKVESNEEVDFYVGPANMPPLSPLTVTREEKLTTALQQLKPAEYIVLHGMKGFGKSSLTANSLQDKRLPKNVFSNQIYWIKFTCDRSIDDEILIQLNTLYHNMKNLAIQPEQSFTLLEKDSLIRFFEGYFCQPDNRNALLILDGVSDKKIVNAFDFKCKTLVLTADINVVEGKVYKKIEMNDGFTETETLGLFAKVLEMDVDKLPIQAKRIHEECKGMPLLIAMFAAQFEEFKFDMKMRSNRWKYYLESLKKKDAKNKVIREFFKKQETIFDMCIAQLKPNLKEYYKNFAIFNEEVNITSKTLSILWDEDIYQVDELMLDLCHKSLAAKKWNEDLKSYIYGIHDLLLCHLRTKLTQEELRQMHISAIEKYRKHCDYDFSKLPDDNYIYSYIGHHLEEAELFNEFPKLYLDFGFIQAKIIHSGLTDLLLDLKKYRGHIIYFDNRTQLNDIEKFLQEQAHIIIEHRRKKCLDIIQIAMNYPYEGYVMQTAKQLAMTKGQYLYLSHHKNLEHVNTSLTHELPMDICTSVFTDYSNWILIGTKSGKIILWNCKNNEQQVFNGHNHEDSIKKLIVSTNGDCFLSLSSAGIIKLFPLHLNDELESNDHNTHLESPRQKQSSWSNIFKNNNDLDDSVVKFSIKDEMVLDMAFGYNEQYVVACTNKSRIQMWNRKGELVFTEEKKEPTEIITKITFTAECSLLHIMDESKMSFSVYTNCNNYASYRYLACFNPCLLRSTDKKVIFFHHIPKKDNWLMIVTEKQALHVKWCWDGYNVHSFDKQRKVCIENGPVTYVCATITYDGEYMITADSAGYINVWQTSGGDPIIAIYKSRVTSLDTYHLEEEGCHIICGNGKRSFYKWKFPTQELNKKPGKYSFDAIVKPYDQRDIIVKESQLKKIIISYGEETIELDSNGKIVNLQLSSDGKEVVYVTGKNLMVYNITTRTSSFILNLEKVNIFLKIINVCNSNIIMCEQNDNDISMWQHTNLIGTIPATMIDRSRNITARLINIHKLMDNHVAIITQTDIKIIQFNLCTETWKLTSITKFHLSSHISFSCVSRNKIYLAVLSEAYELALYYFCKNKTVLPPYMEMNEDPYFIHLFPWKVTCCDISQNEQFIAVGTEKGQISIIDIRKQIEIIQLSFHKDPIIQLFWAPTTIDVSILLSVTNNELVWWNIALAKSTMKRTRMGIRHSTSTPSFNLNPFGTLQMPSSRSMDANISNLQNNVLNADISANAIRTVSEYWTDKRGRDPEMPELLAVVELPPNPHTKLHVSTDFTKFMTVDMYGSVSIFKLIDYNNISKV
ncbi:apoptotic protease-activating factor 1 isoform X2 [Camponotus floridanus]|uniref:apoptotic protease-activating factor 1 isoform X2 n=1 Tax=Camponotus floridanus TaxID=104421 RepID=UPI00059BACEA|nr:apoptotic protease-activating factor 1 isoform X2 [Camponotus floridanus]